MRISKGPILFAFALALAAGVFIGASDLGFIPSLFAGLGCTSLIMFAFAFYVVWRER